MGGTRAFGLENQSDNGRIFEKRRAVKFAVIELFFSECFPAFHRKCCAMRLLNLSKSEIASANIRQ
jgi:hypothetical protein